MEAPVDRQTSRSGWARLRIACVEDLTDAVYGAGLTVAQMSHAPITGSLAFTVQDGVTYSSGLIEGRVALRGALSEKMVTVGTGLKFAPGTRQWLNEVVTGEVGLFLAGDEHDAFYTPSALYATATLEIGRLEELAAREELVLDARTLGGSGIATGRIAEGALACLRKRFERVHRDIVESSTTPRMLGESLLDALIAHLGRPPRPWVGRTAPLGIATVVARARDFIQANLGEPLSIDAIAAGARTSRRTLQRAFREVLDETVQTYVRKLRLHRIRNDLATEAEARCTVATVANRWGIGELGRLSGRYKELFGELPSETIALCRTGTERRSSHATLARSA